MKCRPAACPRSGPLIRCLILSASPLAAEILYVPWVSSSLRPLRSLWSEPPPPSSQHSSQPPSQRPWLDIALVAVLAPLAIVEALVRDDVPGRPLALASALVVIALLAWRQRHPFLVFCAAFAIAVGVDVVAFVVGAPSEPLYVSAAILFLPYSLFRWGAGRHAVIGLGVLALVYVSSAATDEMKDVSERIGAAVVLLMPAAIGAAVRFRAQAQRREVDAVRSRERERLARDLHDTVAHHVSAIAIQAQAGRVVLRKQPDAAERALAAIEAEASRALVELRSLVGILREGDAPLAPQPGLKDVERLARDSGDTGDGRVVDVVLRGDLDGLRPSVEAAVFRIAQEAVTNAVRHARDATRIAVTVDGERQGVRVCIEDDGATAAPADTRTLGYGLAGMAERASLLGGTFRAGPREERGWRVEAFIPHEGTA
jgi:signal transduction histidine kinase